MIKTGTILGDRYEILEKIGTGGMAEGFKGKDEPLRCSQSTERGIP